MSQKYTYPCPSCENPLAIEISQAGQSVQCACGTNVLLPAMRKIRELQLSESPSQTDVTNTTDNAAANRNHSWSLRHGFQAACLLSCLASLGISAYLRATQPSAPVPFDNKQQAQEGIESLTPTDAFHVWVQYYSNLENTGFQVFHSPLEAAHSNEIVQQTFMQKTFLLLGLVLAGICIAIFVIPTSLPAPSNPVKQD